MSGATRSDARSAEVASAEAPLVEDRARTTRIPALPTLSPSALLPRLAPRPRLPFPLDRVVAHGGPANATLEGVPPAPHSALYYLARNGIYHGLRALGVGPGSTVLMPSYHHGVEVEAVRRTGAEPLFYRVDRRWRADLDDARVLLRGARRPTALYLTHYAGFAQDLAAARALCREHELLLVEDCALSLLAASPDGAPLGSSGDLAVFCLYKSLPVPHGGLALARAPLPMGARPPLVATLHHLGGSLLANDELHAGRRLAWERLRRLSRRTVDRVATPVQVGTMHLRPSELRLGASRIVPALVRRVDAGRVVARRRRNYHRLLAQLDDRALFAEPLPPGACPLFFPLLVEDKPPIVRALAARGVEAVDFWSSGDPGCEPSAFADVQWLRRRVLELPIHQDLDDEAIDRVAREVKQVVRRT